MTALNLIKKCAVLLNIEDVLTDTSLNSITEQNEDVALANNSTLNRLFELLKLMLQDISCDYVQIVKEGDFTAVNKEIPLSSITNLLKVKSVMKDNVNSKYHIANGSIVVNSDGVYKIKYYVSPDIESLLDNVEVFDGRVGVDLMLYGLASLYCLAMGLFDEFNVYNVVYNEKLSAIKNLKVISMPCRSWE